MVYQHVVRDMLNDLLEDQPQSALYIAQNNEHFDGLDGDYVNVSTLLSLPFTQRYDVACMVCGHEIDLHAVVRLRDLFAKSVIVVCHLGEQLRSLGFTQVVHQQNMQVWQFNILTYKHVPDWFNAKFWANPQNWDKFRW